MGEGERKNKELNMFNDAGICKSPNETCAIVTMSYISVFVSFRVEIESLPCGFFDRTVCHWHSLSTVSL